MRGTGSQAYPQELMEKARKLARHELGHWIIARRLGFVACDVTAMVTYNGWKGGAGIILKENLDSIAKVISYLERRIQVCWAGVVAEALGGGNADVKVDVIKAVELCEGDSGR